MADEFRTGPSRCRPGRVDHQLRAEIEAVSFPATARTGDRSGNWRTFPDIRYWFVDDNGQRNVKFIVTGQDNATVANVASELAAQVRRLPLVENVYPARRSIVPSCGFIRAATWRYAWACRPRACRKPSG